MPSVDSRAKAVREKLYPSQRKMKPMEPFNPKSLPAPPPFQRAINRAADKYKRRGK